MKNMCRSGASPHIPSLSFTQWHIKPLTQPIHCPDSRNWWLNHRSAVCNMQSAPCVPHYNPQLNRAARGGYYKRTFMCNKDGFACVPANSKSVRPASHVQNKTDTYLRTARGSTTRMHLSYVTQKYRRLTLHNLSSQKVEIQDTILLYAAAAFDS